MHSNNFNNNNNNNNNNNSNSNNNSRNIKATIFNNNNQNNNNNLLNTNGNKNGYSNLNPSYHHHHHHHHQQHQQQQHPLGPHLQHHYHSNNIPAGYATISPAKSANLVNDLSKLYSSISNVGFGFPISPTQTLTSDIPTPFGSTNQIVNNNAMSSSHPKEKDTDVSSSSKKKLTASTYIQQPLQQAQQIFIPGPPPPTNSNQLPTQHQQQPHYLTVPIKSRKQSPLFSPSNTSTAYPIDEHNTSFNFKSSTPITLAGGIVGSGTTTPTAYLSPAQTPRSATSKYIIQSPTSSANLNTNLAFPTSNNVSLKKSNSLKVPVRPTVIQPSLTNNGQVINVPTPPPTTTASTTPTTPSSSNSSSSTPTSTLNQHLSGSIVNLANVITPTTLPTSSTPNITAHHINSTRTSPNQRKSLSANSKHHHQQLPQQQQQQQQQHQQANVPIISVSTNNYHQQQQQQQLPYQTQTSTISPIQLQNLTQSPSVSEIRTRTRSKSNTNHSKPNNNHHHSSSSSKNSKNSSNLNNTNTSLNTSSATITSNSGNNNNHHNHHNNHHHHHHHTSSKNLKKTLQNIELKMRIVSSPNIRIADLFKCFLKNVPKSTETIEGPALCVTYDAVLRDEHWDEIFICNDEEITTMSNNNNNNNNNTNGTSNGSTNRSPTSSNITRSKSFLASTQKSLSNHKNNDNNNSSFSNGTNTNGTNGGGSSSTTSSSSSSSSGTTNNANQASKFMSFFHISDFIAILSGYKVAFVDPYERIAPDERSYVAIFDLEHDTHDIEQFEDQFKPLEKIFNVPLLKNRYYNGTIIRLPLRTQTSTCSVSNKLVYVKDILVNAKDFMKEAHLHILFAKNISNIQFCRTKDNQNIEKIYSINVEESCMDQFKQKYKKISDAISDGEFPRTSTIIITLRKQIETKIEKTEWILSIFADTMRLLNSNYFLMKLAIPISDNCDKDIRFSHKSNLISSDTGFIKTLYLTKPIICYIEDKEGILMSHFCRLNISDSLKLSHFNDAYALMLKDLTKIIRKDPALLWSLMPDLDKNTEFSELLGEIWQEISKHELFYSCTEGWGYVAIEDMIINDVEDQSILQEILTKVYSETNYPVVIMPQHVLRALQKFSPKDSLQIMTPSQTSDILHNNVSLIEQLKANQKIELLKYLIKEPNAQQVAGALNMSWPASAARYILDLPLLLLANQKFIRFQAPNKVKSVYLVDKEYMPLFQSDSIQLSQYINPDLPKDVLSVLKKFEFQRLTQVQMISDSDLNELINVPKEWRNGDEKIYWPKQHDKYNLEWLETLWKYLCEYCQTDLSMIENLNIIYTSPSILSAVSSTSFKQAKRDSSLDLSSKNLVLYKLTNNSNLVYTPFYDTVNDQALEFLNDDLYASLIKILNKIGFQCIEALSQTILAHPLFQNYVPNIKKSRFSLIRAFRNKYRHASLIKITQDFNALLNETDIKLLQQYLSKIDAEIAPNEHELVEYLKELPIFENSALDCSDKYLPIKEALFIYDTPIRLPFELPGIKPFVYIEENESKFLIIEKLNLNLVKDFSVIIKEIVKYCSSNQLNSLNSYKIHSLGKWLLLNCANYILANQTLNDCIKTAKLFMNQNQELCAPNQFINPIFKEKFLPILDPKCLPAKDLLVDEKCINILKELKMRNCIQLKVDEIIDLYEHSIKQTDTYRRLLAELIIEILMNRLHEAGSLESIEKTLNEYSTSKAVTLRHFLMSVNWIPLQRERPQSYPQSLLWKGAESSSSAASAAASIIKFSSPRDCVDSHYAYCAGSVACVSDLEIPTELKVYIDLKQVHLDLVVRHLKLTTKCFESSALKVEWYDYLTVAKRCYEFMSTNEPQDIYRELKSNDLNEWIWNGAGFSSINSIYILNEKDHPLSSHVSVLPYELYVFLKFFERLGIKKQPDSKQLEQIIFKCVKNTQKLIGNSKSLSQDQTQLILENAAKNYPLINYIKTYYSTEKKLISNIKDYEESLINLSILSNGGSPPINPFISTNGSSTQTSPNKTDPTKTQPTSPNPIKLDDLNMDNSDNIFLYLPELYKSIEIKDNLINSVMTLVKNRQIKILDEEAYLMRKHVTNNNNNTNLNSSSSSSNSTNNNSTKNQTNNIYDHYRVYNEIILPNLNSLSKNVKDSVVLFALDHADPKMLEILRDHPCIPVSPFGRRLKKPNKLVHPMGKIAPLYSDSDERFPCGSEETYIREDRLQILKILGMKCDHLSWSELVERAESVSKIREYDLAVERSIAILNLLNEMLNNSMNQSQSMQNGNGSHSPPPPTNSKYFPDATKEEKESKCKACEQIRDIAFIPVKPKPYQKLNLNWFGDKFKYRFAKPKELLSSSYENICSTIWPIPLNEYKKKENLITKQIEQFLGIDDIISKLSIRDVFRQLDEVCKINLQDIDDSKEVKLVSDITFQIYEYLQMECQKKPNELTNQIREFFQDNNKRCILINEEFVSTSQLCWNLNVNLKPMFYQIPNSYLRSFKYLFSQTLNIRLNLDLPDLLHVVDSIKKKYKDSPIINKDDFNILMNVYSLMIDQGYQIITNLYLPNINSVLLPGRLLYFHPMNPDQLDRPEDYVHPAVDRRICVIAGATMNKKMGQIETAASFATLPTTNSLLSIQHNMPGSTPVLSSPSSGRIFPRVFGNKRLEGILARLDDDRIDINYINNMDEGNPQIILDYLLEANRVHSLSAFLSEDDIFVMLKYFNDFLARNYQAGTFQRLKELKIYKPLWSEKYINLNFTGSSVNSPSSSSPLNLNIPGQSTMVPNVYLINEEMASLMKRSFKLSPFVQKQTVATGVNGSPVINNDTSSSSSNTTNPTTTPNSQQQANSPPIIIIVRRAELSKLYAHLNLLNLNDLEAFLHLCLPQFKKLDSKAQNNFLKYLYEEILEKSYIHEKEKCFKILRDKLYIQTRKGDQQLISDLYDMKSETLKYILNDSYFPDENFDSPLCLRFLKEAGLRTYLPSELCKKCMNEIETKVTDETSAGGWTDELRARSKWLYQHLVENWQRFDDSVLQQRFLEPHCPDQKYVTLRQPFEYSEFNKTCLKLSDAELQKYEMLIWSSSYVLPSFVNTDSLDNNTVEFLKLNRKPYFALVNQHLSNICESIGAKIFSQAQDDSTSNGGKQGIDDALIEVLGKIYQYLDDLNINEHHKDMYKQLEDKEIVWSSTTRKFISPNKICIQLDPVDEIPPFLYSLTPSLRGFKNLLLRLGAKDKPFAMLYGDILRKMAKVCGDDYLNSNELCKGLKAMECFFKYLKINNSSDSSNSAENVTSQYKLPGLYFVTTELKLEKSSSVVILDNRENLDDIAKLPHDKFVFNPGEKVFKMNTNEIKPLIDKIFISQRPTLFSQKYEATYDFTLPDDPDSQRQNLLTSLERKYQQIFTSRQLHRCLARCISNEEARRSSPKHLPIDEVEKVIRERLSSIKVTCVEYLETSLSYRKLSNQQKIEQTVEEKACYLTHESLQFATLYVSKKHIEQPYFSLCLARALQPLLIDLHFDYSIFTSLIATSVSQMSRLLQLVNVATEENILSVIKLQYVPSSGKLYGDDVNLLAPYDPKLHNVLIGDLCVFSNEQGAYIYCQIVKIIKTVKPNSAKKDYSNFSKSSSSNGSSSNEQEEFDYEFMVQIDDNQTIKINQKDMHVLENWHRIYDAMIAKPPDERESFKYQENSSTKTNSNTNSTQNDDNSSSGKRTPGDGEENFSSNASDSSDKSDTSSNFGSNENIPNNFELEQAKTEVNQELRLLWGLEENDRKKKINRLLLKWHPDKNPGKEKFASEVFKHLKKQIELYKTDPFLAGFYRSTYSSYSGFNASSTSGTGAGTSYGTSGGTTGSTGTDDYRSRHYGSFEDLHRKGSPGGGSSPHSSPSREGPSASSTGYDYDSKGPGPSNLGRAGSFRQEWERRRQQKRQTAGTDPRDRSSPSSARRRGTDFTQMDASLWFTQAKCDLDSANNDMHPITGKPAYEWVCYKCYRAVEKALRAYHYFKGNGKLPASDIHGLLLGVETNIRDIAFRFCNFIGNEANSMQYPGIARFGKTPNEVFPLTKAEQALDYGKELLKLVEETIYAN